jgi:hypothetical protein
MGSSTRVVVALEVETKGGHRLLPTVPPRIVEVVMIIAMTTRPNLLFILYS